MSKTKKLISTIILSLVCILSFSLFFSSVNFSKVNAEEETLTIVVSDQVGKPGETVDIKLSLKENPGIASIGINVSYGENLTLTNVTFNSEMGGQTGTSNYAKNGSPVKLIWVNGTENYTEDSTFATLTFSILEGATLDTYDTITITYDKEDIYDIEERNINTEVVNGVVYFSNAIAGDINGDNAVNNKDITRLIQYLADWEVEVNKFSLDVNGDGKINNKDITRLIQYITGWEVDINLTMPIKVEFDGNGGTLVEGSAVQFVFNGEDATAPTFEREGYEFIGYDKEYTNITEKTTITAQWEEKAVQGSQGLAYTLINNDTEYEVSGIGTCTDTKLIIPEIYNNKPVTCIKYEAFAGTEYNPNKTLTSVVIGNSVKFIEPRAFSYCSALTSVIIGENVTYIGEEAFNGCSSLTSVEIPDSVRSIGWYAFFGCKSLISVVIGDSVTSIGCEAFMSCSSLTSVVIPNSVTSIERAAFCGCSSLISVVIGDSVTNIGQLAFKSCKSLTSIEIPDSVTSIDIMVFNSCSSLTSINVDENNAYYKSIDGNLYSKDGKTLIQYAIGKTETEFVMPDSVTSVGNMAFESCSFLTSIVIGNSVTSIENYAFSDCSALTSVTFNDTTTWYYISNYTNWQNKTGGTEIDVTNASKNATYLNSTHNDYYWYKK